MPKVMMVKVLILGVLISGWHLPVLAANDDIEELQAPLTNEWRLVKSDRLRNIKTYVRLEDGKRYRSFRAEMVMDNVKPEALIRLILDFKNYPKWFWETREAKLLQKISDTEYYVYMIHDAPYGLPDRDVILHAVVSPQTTTKPYLDLTIKAAPNYLPLKPPLVRMVAEDLFFRFTPLANGQLKSESEGYVDPGGIVPSWAANFVQRSAPYAVALGALRMAKRDEYVNSEQALPFKVYHFSDYLAQ